MADENKQRHIKFNNRGELQKFYAALLESGMADGIVLPVKNRTGQTVPALITEPEKLESEDTFSEVIPVQGGRIAKNLTFTNSGKKIAIICKPCEVKAIVELSKFLQVKKDRLIVIGTDCVGTYEMKEAATSGAAAQQDETEQPYTERFRRGDVPETEENRFRKACTICSLPAASPDIADAVLGFIGMPDESYILTLREDSPLAGLIWNDPEHPPETDSADEAAAREKLLEKFETARAEKKEKILEEFGSEIDSLEKIQEKLSKCIRCHNCMVACPICYCRECVFRSPTFEHSSESIINWAERKGGMRMLENTLLFHLTRLNHMATSCIACGLCSSACPNDIDVATLFIHSGEKVQKMLSYQAGRSYEETPPVTTFREDELNEETGAR